VNWLLLRGLAREQRHWHEFSDRLVERLPSGRVQLLDVAGAGTEWRRRPHPSIEWLARDVARRMPEAAANGPSSWGVLGISLGGMIALELCRLLPGRIARAVVVNSSSRLSGPATRFRPLAAARLARVLLCRDDARREEIVLEVTSRLAQGERTRYARLAAEFTRDAPMSPASVLMQLAAAARFSPPSLVTPLLLVCSRRDGLVNPRCTRDLAAFYGCGFEEHPDAGHDLALDDPDWLCERTLRFEAASKRD
jgi:pimeloyl-ACP methyl ester carboxylesterase